MSKNMRAQELQLAPHHYCDGEPAGDGDLAKNATDTIFCHWPPHGRYGDPWGTHLPETSCRIETRTCGAHKNLSVPWLSAYTKASGCFLGPDGTNVFANAYDFTQPCSS